MRCRMFPLESVRSGSSNAPPEPRSMSSALSVLVLYGSKKSRTARSPAALGPSLMMPLPKSLSVGKPLPSKPRSKVPLASRK
jgi:hypothetical protein